VQACARCAMRQPSLLATVAACTAGGPATTATQQTTREVLQAATRAGGCQCDVQSFKVNLWENIRTSDKCGGCHHEGGQSRCSPFDDVNLAYQAANPLVNFTQPDQSTLVLRVASVTTAGLPIRPLAATPCSLDQGMDRKLGTSSTGVTVTPLRLPT